MSERVSFGTVSCGVVGFGVRKGVFRHHFLWRGGFRCQKGCFSAPFLVASGFRCQKGYLSAQFFVASGVSVSERLSFGTGSLGVDCFCAKMGHSLHKVRLE